MNYNETEDFTDRIVKSTKDKNLDQMLETLSESIRILRGHISQDPSSFEKNKEAIEKEIIAAKTIMSQMTKRLNDIGHSVDQIVLNYGPVYKEIRGIPTLDTEGVE